MPVIAQKVIRKPRKVRRCERCGEMIAGAQRRFYGRAHESDPAYAIYQHADVQTCFDVERERYDRLAASVPLTPNRSDSDG
jgi:hypothetical protein